MEKRKSVIIGSGPAGYTAGIYLGRANMQPLLLEGMQPGGQLTITTEVENFPGYPDGVDPYTMMGDIRRQAERFGCEMRSGVVTKVDLKAEPKLVWVDDNEEPIEAETVIIATGASAKWLGLPSERAFRGLGVSACATCDGFFFRKKTVAIVGGGDTACEEALYLSGICEKVYMLVRKPYLRASAVLQDRVLSNPKIEVKWEANTLQLTGEGKVEGVDIVLRKGEADEREEHLAISGFFLAIGHKPNSDLVKGQLELNEDGYILTEAGTPRTAIPGVYAAGDVADPRYRQAVVAAASGCMAAMEIVNN